VELNGTNDKIEGKPIDWSVIFCLFGLCMFTRFGAARRSVWLGHLHFSLSMEYRVRLPSLPSIKTIQIKFSLFLSVQYRLRLSSSPSIKTINLNINHANKIFVFSEHVVPLSIPLIALDKSHSKKIFTFPEHAVPRSTSLIALDKSHSNKIFDQMQYFGQTCN
jgi:hypothetical protein